ncbi:MAG: uroporphyrinogen decarboxylase [bacterium]
MTTTGTLANDRLLRAARGETLRPRPIWMMRQAGRVLPEYRAFREKHSFLDVSHTPELCAEVTTQPVDRLGVDAAILFSDILTPLPALGIDVDFKPGPVLARTLSRGAGVETLRRADPARDWKFLDGNVRATLDRLAGRVPLIGFAGAPFTVACYAIDGGGSKHFSETRAWMHADPDGFRALLEFLADELARWLQVQVDAGVHAFQLFDSWAGLLSPADLERFALPAARRVLHSVKVPADFPTIYFAPGAGGALDVQAMLPARVLGIDWRVDLAEVRRQFPDRPLQGNLDPAVLLGRPETIRERVGAILDVPGPHIFNLGHGILPETPVQNAELLVRLVHESGGDA